MEVTGIRAPGCRIVPSSVTTRKKSLPIIIIIILRKLLLRELDVVERERRQKIKLAEQNPPQEGEG